MSERPLILLCAGGTGGHMFPAKALAEELLKQGFQVALACDNRGAKYFGGMGEVDIRILASGTYRAGLLGKLGFIWPLVKGFFQAQALISEFKPVAAVGFGGYPSAPPMFAAVTRFIPTILHEQNAIFGLANKLLAPFAKTIALSSETRDVATWNHKTVLTGNPVRAEIARLADQSFELSGKIRILIVGGSQGARVFSSVIPDAITGLPDDFRLRLEIVQQVRLEDMDAVQSVYANAGIAADLKNFFEDMPQQIAAAHLLITRSGATTIAELTAAGRPAIYIPYPYNRDNQQVFNAEAVTARDGGWMIEEKNLTAETLRHLLQTLLADPLALSEAAARAKTLGRPDAARALAEQVNSSFRQKI